MRPPRLMITDQFAGYATPGRQQPTKKAGQLQHPLPPRAVWQLLDHAEPELEAASSPKRVAGDLSRACDSRHYGGGWMGIIPIGHPPWTMLAASRRTSTRISPTPRPAGTSALRGFRAGRRGGGVVVPSRGGSAGP